MVLNPSDYQIPQPGETMDPTDPRDFVTRVVGLLVVLSVVAWSWATANNVGVDVIDGLTSRIGFSSQGATQQDVI